MTYRIFITPTHAVRFTGTITGFQKLMLWMAGIDVKEIGEHTGRTCDSCKWWDEVYGRETQNPCMNETFNYPALAGVAFTGPKFGCIHYEPK